MARCTFLIACLVVYITVCKAHYIDIEQEPPQENAQDIVKALRSFLDVREGEPPNPDADPKDVEIPVPLPEDTSTRDTAQRRSGNDGAVELTRRSDNAYIVAINMDTLGPTHLAGKLRPGHATHSHSCDSIRGVPAEINNVEHMWPSGIPSFYKKYTEAYGIPILGSNDVTDAGLKRACYEIWYMLGPRYDIRNAYFKLYGRIALIGDNEQQTTLPEYTGWDSSYWDARARGLGATIGIPTTSAGDSNMRCDSSQRYKNQDILTHEFGHGVHLMSAVYVVEGFARRIGETYKASVNAGKWEDTYAGSNMNEYFATGMQFFLNATSGFEVKPKNSGVVIASSTDLYNYDYGLYTLLKETMPCDTSTFIERCQYNEQKTPSVPQLCGEGAHGTDRCTSVDERIPYGPPDTDKTKCKKMGGCWGGARTRCFYPKAECADDHIQCAMMAMTADCDRNPIYTAIHCPFSCSVCDAHLRAVQTYTKDELDAMCQDKHSACLYWSNSGYCEKNPGYMGKTCQVACKFCTPVPF